MEDGSHDRAAIVHAGGYRFVVTAYKAHREIAKALGGNAEQEWWLVSVHCGATTASHLFAGPWRGYLADMYVAEKLFGDSDKADRAGSRDYVRAVAQTVGMLLDRPTG